jgi:hypothetical protein
MPGLDDKVLKFVRQHAGLHRVGLEPDYINALNASSFLRHIHPRYRHEYDDLDIFESMPADYQEEYYDFGLKPMKAQDFESLPLKEIPDSPEYVLIDVGSSLGRRITRPFSTKRPNTRVIMIDCLTREDLEDESNYTSYETNEISGKELITRVRLTDNIEESANRLLKANGYDNIIYVNHKLTLGSLTRLVGLIHDKIDGKKIYLTGNKNPRGLGDLTCRFGVLADAYKICLNNSALEKMSVSDEKFEMVQDYLSKKGFKRDEIQKYLSLIAWYEKDSQQDRYDYSKDTERIFAKTLKLAYALAQKEFLERNGYSVEITDCIHRFGNGSFNLPDHNIIATRKQTE